MNLNTQPPDKRSDSTASLKRRILRMGYQVCSGFYKRKDIYVWQTPKGFCVAQRKDLHFYNHQYFDSLLDALKAGLE